MAPSARMVSASVDARVPTAAPRRCVVVYARTSSLMPVTADPVVTDAMLARLASRVTVVVVRRQPCAPLVARIYNAMPRIVVSVASLAPPAIPAVVACVSV